MPDTRKHPLAECENCGLKDAKYVPTHFGEDGSFAFVGEGPGYNEVREGRPFVGQSGKLLDMAAKYNDLDISEHVLTNAVACRPPRNRKPTEKEMRCCRPRLMHQLAGSETIVTLGKAAANSVLGSGVRYSKRISQWFHKDGMDIICTWHPAYLLRVPQDMYVLLKDLARAKRGRNYGPLTREPGFFVPADAEQLKECLDSCPEGATVAYDLETDNVIWYDTPEQPGDDILMLGMAWSPDEAVIIGHEMLMHDEDARQVIQDFFDRDDLEFTGHNVKFDEIFLRREGIIAHSTFDTFLAHYVVNENGIHGLKALAAEYYDLHDYEEALVQKYLKSRNDRYSKVPFIHMAQYCAWDVCVSWALKFQLEKELHEEGQYEWPFKNIIMRAHHAVAEMEYIGMPWTLTIFRNRVTTWRVS